MAREPIDEATAQRRRDVCLEACKRETPTFLIWVGLIIVVLEVVNYLVPPQEELGSYVRTAALGAIFGVIGALMRRSSFPAAWVPWVFVACATLLGLLLLLDYRSDARPANLAWIVALLLLLGPATESFRPFVFASTLLYAAVVGTLIVLDVPDVAGWILVITASLAASGILLRRRLHTLYALAEARLLTEHLATTDPLTGLLNRHGLTERVPALCATASRHGEGIFTCFIDIRGLKAANDIFGHEVGDRVIVTVAGGVASCVREDDLVARWGGDEFLIVGIGVPPPAEEIEARVHAFVRASGMDPSTWAGHVSGGCASGMAALEGMDDLVKRAHDEMYRRRSEAVAQPHCTDRPVAVLHRPGTRHRAVHRPTVAGLRWGRGGARLVHDEQRRQRGGRILLGRRGGRPHRSPGGQQAAAVR